MTTSTDATTDAGMQDVERCFFYPGEDCPTVQTAIEFFNCTDAGELVTGWHSGPTLVDSNCCYHVDVTAPAHPDCGPVGRPFVVDGEVRVAAVGPGERGWTGPAVRSVAAAGGETSPDLAGLDEATRARLGRLWAGDAAFEHASVASFGKLALELLAFGAPAELLRATHEAALDEVRHAQIGFALASRYLGAPIGPGPLPEARAFTGATSLAELAAAAVREGCFGETLAAAVAAAQHAGASDRAVRAALAAIAEEESRHAELAFKVVAWAIARGGAAVRQRVAIAFAEALAEARAAAAPDSEDVTPAMRAHGRLPLGEVLAERRRTAETVVVPAMRQLLGLPC
ncbi:ferritin-like domain-containing protein [Nannocystis radixulma]|uniref:Ferritin-like domain-containing protein n=1 Tax=Nannocystis radixulma TaxID=2995305 RepID=A0ABT5AX50_9BACT|nr:ferritin-like domain-containing protein [Nannocystis radixulma]MDC0666424.1 ferritin-like domain-containing protein [Nannocystis radixulma]